MVLKLHEGDEEHPCLDALHQCLVSFGVQKTVPWLLPVLASAVSAIGWEVKVGVCGIL